jgi:hypothetical protein
MEVVMANSNQFQPGLSTGSVPLGRQPIRARRVPVGLPLLGPGQHQRAEHGACLMEYVSVLAGLPFTDRPRCTHPALARLARLVNDRIDSDVVRSELAVLAPALIGARGPDPRIAETLAATCLWAVARAGLGDEGIVQALKHHHGRLKLLSRSRRWRVWSRMREFTDPGASVSAAFALAWSRARRLPSPERDRWLSELLGDAVEQTCCLTGPTAPLAGHRAPNI